MDPPSTAVHSDAAPRNTSSNDRRESFTSVNSQTATEFINSQLKLEADAREALPYSFDTCTQPLGPLRQILFSCLTCNPPPSNPEDPYTAAGVCYSCSISCHGEHTLVELFSKRNFVCDCGTTRLPATSPCTLRADPQTGSKGGVHSQTPASGNKYNHNFRNKFCGCGEDYDAFQEKGTMYQCLGLGTVETGGCGEDWWHPECLVGLPRGWHQSVKKENEAIAQEEGKKEDTNDAAAPKAEHEDDDEEELNPLPPGFPEDEEWEALLCYKCVESNPWLKRYANTPGFTPLFYKKEGGLERSETAAETTSVPGKVGTQTEDPSATQKKRKAEDEDTEMPDLKRAKSEDLLAAAVPADTTMTTSQEPPKHKHDALPSRVPAGSFSLFMKEDFRDQFCRCPSCFPHLAAHPQLREEEDTYEPPLSDDGGDGANGGGSQGTGSLLDRGEAALSNIDRVRAIEGAMVYNHLRDKVKEFLKPFAESGQAVSADDIKSYFEKLRGDDQAIKDAGGKAHTSSGDGEDGSGGNDNDNRKEQSGY